MKLLVQHSLCVLLLTDSRIQNIRPRGLSENI
nr:MAG TPA: hypothetical protein [Caudoviricetes sp.]